MQTTTIQFTNNPHPTHQTSPKRPASSVERKPDSVPQPQSKDHDQKMFATPNRMKRIPNQPKMLARITSHRGP